MCNFINEIDVNMSLLKNQFFTYIGGQNIQCSTHTLPHIPSIYNGIKCNRCGKKASIICTEITCNDSSCKSCSDPISSNEIIFIGPCADESIHNSIHENNKIITDDQSTVSGSSSSLQSNIQFENFLTSTINDDISI